MSVVIIPTQLLKLILHELCCWGRGSSCHCYYNSKAPPSSPTSSLLRTPRPALALAAGPYTFPHLRSWGRDGRAAQGDGGTCVFSNPPLSSLCLSCMVCSSRLFPGSV